MSDQGYQITDKTFIIEYVFCVGSFYCCERVQGIQGAAQGIQVMSDIAIVRFAHFVLSLFLYLAIS